MDGNKNAHIVHLGCQLANDGFAVDIIDLAGKLLNVVVDEVCTVPVTTLEGWVRNPDAAGFVPRLRSQSTAVPPAGGRGDVVNPSQMLEKIEGVHTETGQISSKSKDGSLRLTISARCSVQDDFAASAGRGCA